MKLRRRNCAEAALAGNRAALAGDDGFELVEDLLDDIGGGDSQSLVQSV
jgi:hypothetical protein